MATPLTFAEINLDDTMTTGVAFVMLGIVIILAGIIVGLGKKRKKYPLKSNESLITSIGGYIGKAFGSGEESQVNGELVVTNHRVMFYSKGLFSERIVGIDLKDISTIDHKSTLGHRTISLRSPSSVLEFKTYDKKNFQQLLDAIDSQRQRAQSTGLKVTGVADELRKLSELMQEGVLTQEDFEKSKELYLGKSPSKQEEAAKLLRSLHELYKAGTLSESEFNMKKWDVLARS